MISGPLSLHSLPPDLESRLRLNAGHSKLGPRSEEKTESPRQRPSDIMVAAVTARHGLSSLLKAHYYPA